MPLNKKLITVMGIAITLGVAIPALAEAPVYDADAVTQQLDNSDQMPASDQLTNESNRNADRGNMNNNQEDLPPPPPEPDTFVPDQPAANPAPTVSVQSMTLEQRMKRAEQQLANLQSNDAAARIESLQDQVQTLRGQVEQLTHQLQQMQTQQKAQYTDLDKRLSGSGPAAPIKANPDATAAADAPLIDEVGTSPDEANKLKARKAKALKEAAAKAATANQPNVAEEQQIYQTAYNMIKAKRYEEAATALQGMLKKYPSGQFASNAHYWLGELYGLMGKNDQALSEFNTVVKTFPDSPRVSDAQLKVALLLASQEKWSEAKTAFKKVINHYPGTASSRLAAEQLKQIKQAGH